jgi:predicted nucleotidyltransferase
MKFGLKEEDIAYIVAALSKFDEIKKAAVFGSRAKGNYKPGSDVDIAVFGEDISFSTIAHLHFMLEEDSLMPYFFDIVDYTHLAHQELKDHIERVGITIFERDNSKDDSFVPHEKYE